MYKINTPYYWDLSPSHHLKIAINVELFMIGQSYHADAVLNTNFIKDLENIVEHLGFYTSKQEQSNEIQEWLDRNKVVVKNSKVIIDNSLYDKYKKCTCYYELKDNETISQLCHKTIRRT